MVSATVVVSAVEVVVVVVVVLSVVLVAVVWSAASEQGVKEFDEVDAPSEDSYRKRVIIELDHGRHELVFKVFFTANSGLFC